MKEGLSMPQPKLINAKGSSFFYDQRLSIGVYIKDKKAVLIDSGIDTETAKAVDKLLVKEGCTLEAIINTHYHADHCGGNQYFQGKYKDLKIFATKSERGFIESPTLEPSCFCGTAAPFAALQNKFMQAPPSEVTDVIKEYKDQNITILGETFKIVTLPGHTAGMVGVITPDNVFYCGDAIFRGDTFNKHAVLFYTDIQATFNTLDKIATLANVEKCVFYHGGLMPETENLKDITDAHKQKVTKIGDAIFKILQDSDGHKLSLDDLNAKVIEELKVPQNVMQYMLNKTVVNAYLTYFEQQKRIALAMQNGKLEFVVSDAEMSQKASATATATM